MNYLMIFLMLIVFYKSDGRQPDKIIGGERIDIEFRPSQVSLQWHGHLCGGSILSPNHILTAASCTSINTGVYPANINILIGTNDLLDASNENYIYPVAYIINYPDYKPNKFWKNDICILRLEKPIYYTTKCKNIHLPVHRLGQVNDATISGWGHDFDIPSSPSRYLKMTHVTVLTRSKYNHDLEEFAFTMSNTQRCAITQNTNAGIQRGDAGSAVSHTFKADGIISLQIPNKKYEFIFTQVWSYLDWIEGMIEEY